MVYINLRVVAVSEDDIKDFVTLCSVIQELGRKGANRTIKLTVDGDGSGSFTFYVNNDDKPIVPPKDIDIDNLPVIWLGE